MFSSILRNAFIVPLMIGLLAAVTVDAGCAYAQPAAANSIEIKNFSFVPMNLVVTAGTSVTWKNLDGEPHTVTSTDMLFRSGALDQNDTFTFEFSKPGVYKYVCSIHPMMTANVTVK